MGKLRNLATAQSLDLVHFQCKPFTKGRKKCVTRAQDAKACEST
jgi:hypothetical protein